MKWFFLLFFFIVHSSAENEEYPQSTKLSEIASNHMKLARLANAIYLQTGLMDGSLSADDVVAAVWNLRDKKVLEQLKGFPVANLTVHLTALHSALRKAPDGLEEVNVADIETKMKIVEDVKPAVESIKAAVKMEKYPELITDLLNFDVFKFAHMLLKACIKILDEIAGDSVTTKQLDEAKMRLIIAQGEASTVFKASQDIKDLLEFIKNDKALLQFKTSIPLVRAYLTQKTELAALGNALTKAGTSFDSLKVFFAPTAGITDFKKIIEDARRILESLRDTASPANPVGIAFQDTRSLNEVFDDLSSPWLKTVLNKGNPLQKFIGALKPFSDFSKGFSAINSAFENLESDMIPTAIELLETFLARIEAVGAVSAKVSSLAKFKDCLPQALPTEPAGANEIEELSKQLDGISALLDSVHTPLKDLEDTEYYYEYAIMLQDSIKDHIADKTKPINATLLKDLKAKFTVYSEAVKLAETEVNKHPAFAQYKRVDDVESKIEEVQKWFNETNLADSSKCDLQSMDTSVLAELNDLIKAVNEVKQKKPSAELFFFSSEITNLVNGLEALSGLKKGGGVESNALSLNFLSDKKSELLDLAKGITNFHRMSQVHAAKTMDLQKVIGAGPIVQVAIQSVRDANDKASLTNTWNGFPAVVTTLMAFSAKLDELENKLQVNQEQTLANVAKTYQTASQLQMTGEIDLSPFTNSFPLIDPADQGIKDLEKAFKAIDTPASQDFGLTFASFNLTTTFNNFEQQVEAFNSYEQSVYEHGPNWIIIGAGIGVLCAVAIGAGVFIYRCYFKPKAVQN